MNRQFFRAIGVTGFLCVATAVGWAMTEVTFSRSGSDEIIVEANGQRQVYRQDGTAPHDPWQGHSGTMAAPAPRPRPRPMTSSYSSRSADMVTLSASGNEPTDWTESPTRKKPIPTKGKIVRGGDLPTSIDNVADNLFSEEAEAPESEDRQYDTDPKQAESDRWRAMPEKEMSLSDLQKQVRKLRMENARLNQALNTPLMLFYQGDAVQMQWGNAKQRIALPPDGVVRVRLEPKK